MSNENIPTKIGVSPVDILNITESNGACVIKITPNGDLFWNGRLVETDDDFKGAMLEMGRLFIRNWGRG